MKRVALVTGAAGFLGRYHTEALLEDGYTVIATDLDEEALHSKLGYVDCPELILKKLDVTNDENIQKLSAEFELDVLINNAAIDAKVGNGGLDELGRLEDFSKERLFKEIDVGLVGAVLCSKHFGSRMAKSKGGVIVNISSDLSVISPKQSLYSSDKDNMAGHKPVKPVTYSLIKHGLIGLTKYLATYWPGKVRCNALSPGGVLTNQPIDFLSKINKEIPMKRMAHRTEYKGAIKFLCGDSSSYMNGHNLIIDGGRSIW